jgi:hypothetical protein
MVQWNGSETTFGSSTGGRVPPHWLNSRWAPSCKWLEGLSLGAARECWQKDLLAEKGEASRESPYGRVGAITISASHISASLLGLESDRRGNGMLAERFSGRKR